MIKITHDRKICIGCGACAAVCSNHWEMAEDGKAKLKNGIEKEGEIFELELKEDDCNVDAATSCPVNCIHIDKDGKKIV